MCPDEFLFDFEAVRARTFTLPRAGGTAYWLFSAVQFAVVAHGLFFHPVIGKIHLIAEDIIYGDILRTRREAFAAADPAVMLFCLTLVFSDNLQI